MPNRCSISGCRSNYDTETERMTVFSLPTNASRRREWLDRIPTDFSKLKSPGVCIKHFAESHIIRIDRVLDRGVLKEFPRIRPKLAVDAVPTIFPSAPSEKHGRPRKKLRKDDNDDDDESESDRMDAVVQQILENPPDVVIKEEPIVKEEVEADPDAAGQQVFEFVSVKEEPEEDTYESTSPGTEESSEQMGHDQDLPPLIIKEEIDCDDYDNPSCISEEGYWQ